MNTKNKENKVLLTDAVYKRAFKGKGAVEWLSRLRRDYELVIDEMKQLSDDSKKLSSLPWYLFRHQRKDLNTQYCNGQFYLVWRSYGSKSYTLKWEKVQPYLKNISVEQREWVLEAQEQLLLLNAREMTLRFCINRAEKCSEAIEALE